MNVNAPVIVDVHVNGTAPVIVDVNVDVIVDVDVIGGLDEPTPQKQSKNKKMPPAFAGGISSATSSSGQTD